MFENVFVKYLHVSKEQLNFGGNHLEISHFRRLPELNANLKFSLNVNSMEFTFRIVSVICSCAIQNTY